MPKNIIRRPEVQRRTGYPVSTLYEKIAKGDFPKPVKIGSRSVGWLDDEIDEHIAKLVAKRDGSRRAA